MVDLRSDTVTTPTLEMKEAMFNAIVGDDVFGDDPTVNKLETLGAELFDKEAGLFCPSGVMANQIAIKVNTNPPGELICEALSHVYKYEGGGVGFNAGLATQLIHGKAGQINASQIAAAINPDDVHFPETQLVCLENTCNKGGGTIYPLAEIKKISTLCRQKNLKLHLDGARVFNAIVAANYTSKELGEQFDTISVCLSKGLGAPVGSLLLGSKKDSKKARRIRKVVGGGMRQAGYLAAAGIYGLENNISRLKEDHKRAKELETVLHSLSFVAKVLPVYTNIVVFEVVEGVDAAEIIHQLATKNIKVVAFGPQQIRMVTHLNFTHQMLEDTVKALKNIAALISQ